MRGCNKSNMLFFEPLTPALSPLMWGEGDICIVLQPLKREKRIDMHGHLPVYQARDIACAKSIIDVHHGYIGGTGVEHSQEGRQPAE